MTIRLDKNYFLRQRHSEKWKALFPGIVSLSISLTVTACVLLLNSTGCFQALEWLIFDRYFQLRSGAEATDPRLLVVTIDESDLSYLQQWPLSDKTLAQVLDQINQYNPRVIGLDIYRKSSIPPGTSSLEAVFRNTPHLFGAEKVGEKSVPPPPILADQGQVAMTNLLIDEDGTLRRVLLSTSQQDTGQMSLGAAVALYYLEKDGIVPKTIPNTQTTQLGDVIFSPLQPNDGGYVNANTQGYQLLLNFRGQDNLFETISITDVLKNRVSENLIRDRIVLIGSVAPSLNDFVNTPYKNSQLTGNSQSPGIAIHAHTASQITSAVLDGRPLLKTWPTAAEWGWVFLWCSLSSGLILIPQSSKRSGPVAFLSLAMPAVGLSTSLLVINALCFFNSWWIPTVPALLGIVTSATVGLTTKNLKLKQDAYVDGLTKVMNRRAFNQHMADVQRQSKDLAIILCDVDFFKGFNDFYGHPAGDDCLQKVAKAIQQAVHSQGIVARYGGEEFAVILQAISSEKAYEIAEQMREKVQTYQIPHAKSQVSQYVSISCGVAMRFGDNGTSLTQILNQADQALYQAKQAGRNRAIFFSNP